MADANAQDVSLRLRLLQAAKFRSEARASGRSLRQFGAEADRAGAKNDKLGRTFAALGRNARRFAAIGLAGAGFEAKRMINAASDLNETINLTRVIFGRSGDAILDWSKNSALAMGLSRNEALQAAGNFGGFFKVAGKGQQEAANLSKVMVQLASDMASFSNTTPEDALQALRSGLSGEVEPLRRYRVFLSDAALQQEAARQHIEKHNGQLTDQQKIMLRYSIIMRQTKDAQGDFARTSGGLANQQRILRAQLTNTEAELGAKLLPTFLKIVTATNRFVTQMHDGTGAGGRFADAMSNIGRDAKSAYESLKPLFKFLGDHLKTVTEMAAGFVAIAGAIKVFSSVKKLTGLGKAVQVAKGFGLGTRGASPKNPMWVAVVNGVPGGGGGKGKGLFGKAWGAAKGLGGGLVGLAGAAARSPVARAGGVASGVAAGLDLFGSWLDAHVLGHGASNERRFNRSLGLFHARGGLIGGQGFSDTVPGFFKPGEFVMRREAVREIGLDNLERMNASGASSPSEVVIHFKPQLDSRVIAESVHRFALGRKALA